MKRLIRSTGVVAAATMASRVLGMARDMLMAALFSATGDTDAFFVAFRIPNLVRRFVSEGVFTVSFLPVYEGYRATGDGARARELARKTLSLLLLILTAAAAAGIAFAPQIIRAIARGFDDPRQIDATVLLTRIMVPYLFMAGLLAFAMALLNAHRRFFAPAMAPFLLNVGIIAGMLLFSRWFERPLIGVAAGVLAGGALQLALQLPYLRSTGFRMRFSLDLSDPGLRRMVRIAIPGAFSMGVHQVNTLVVTLLASYLAAGSITYLYYADRLQELVLGVVVVSIGNVVLPELSSIAAAGDMGSFRRLYRAAVSSSLMAALPAAAALMAVGFPIVSVLFMRGRFTPEDADMTFRALLCAGPAVPAMAVARITGTACYAMKDARSPLLAALVSLAVTAVAGRVLMETHLRHAGLALAVTLGSAAQMLALVALCGRRAGGLGLTAVLRSAVLCAAAAAVMAGAAWLAAAEVDWRAAAPATRILALSGIVAGGAALYAGLCLATGVPEARYLAVRVFRRNGKG